MTVEGAGGPLEDDTPWDEKFVRDAKWVAGRAKKLEQLVDWLLPLVDTFSDGWQAGPPEEISAVFVEACHKNKIPVTVKES